MSSGAVKRALHGKGGDVSSIEVEEYISKGLAALDNDHFHLALVCFERAAALTENPLVSSALGLCLTAVRGDSERGVELCRKAIADEPENTSHYYYLGRVLLLSRRRDEAIKALRQGLAVSRDQRIIRELEGLGTRAPAVVSTLHRDHFLNKWLGVVLSRMGFR